MIGGAVALVIALLFSPDPLLPVSRAAKAVFGQLGRAPERTASALGAGDSARAEQALLLLLPAPVEETLWVLELTEP